MVIYKFPPKRDIQEPKSTLRKKNSAKVAIDPLVLTDETLEDGEDLEEENFYESFERAAFQSYSWFARGAAFFLAILFSFMASIVALCLAIFFLGYCCTLGKRPSIVFLLGATWEQFKTLCAMILGFFVAAISPSFGFSIIMLYFMLRQNHQTFFSNLVSDIERL